VGPPVESVTVYCAVLATVMPICRAWVRP